MTIDDMTKAQKRAAREEMRDAIGELTSEIASKRDEIADLMQQLAEARRDLEGLREAKAWRIEALRALRTPTQ
jgi:predicted  nucleic acid-binding Zn-ribbon protein